MTIMFVCTGNTCRSVMAHYYAAKLASDRKLDVKISSSGLEADKDTPMPEIINTLFKKEKIPVSAHVPAETTVEMVKEAGLILAMTRAHRTKIIELFPEAKDRVHTLVEYAGFGSADLADPYGRGEIFYLEAFRLIKKSVEAVFNKLAV
ncbi:MAG: low molecular weight protein arginine phosphatase [Elusimicrobia bacterium]|nr:low molecular weight protein arginine phosphatase [Elusimicrobiota bacterium]